MRDIYHLEPLLHGCNTLKVLLGGSNIPVLLLLGEINHVGREQRLAVLLEVGLILIDHAIQPREELLGAMIGVEDDGDAVRRSDAADVVGSGDGASNGGLLIGVGNTLGAICQFHLKLLMRRGGSPFRQSRRRLPGRPGG